MEPEKVDETMSPEPRPDDTPRSPLAATPGAPDRVSSDRGAFRLVARRAVQFAWLLTLLTLLFGLVHSRDGDPLQFPAAVAWVLSGLLAFVLTAVVWLLSRVRLTVRRMMIAIAVVATLLGVGLELIRRRERFLRISVEHAVEAAMEGTLVVTDQGPAYVGVKTEKGRWHEFTHQKYEYLGRRPWLPVPPDPPEPE